MATHALKPGSNGKPRDTNTSKTMPKQASSVAGNDEDSNDEQIGSHSDNSARKVLLFSEKLAKNMSQKMSVPESKKETERARFTREKRETVEKLLAQTKEFKSALNKRGFQYMEVEGDNFCLFHAVALGLKRPGEGMILLDQVIEHMGNNADLYTPNLSDENLETHLVNLKKNGWGDELEISAMSKMLDMEFELWVPDRIHGASIRPPYTEGAGRLALAYYPGIHYDYLQKLMVKDDILSPHSTKVNVGKLDGINLGKEKDEPISPAKDASEGNNPGGTNDPPSQTEPAKIDAEVLGNVDLSDNKEPIKAAESEQPSEQLLSLGNLSLDNSIIEEGSSLNVSREASGPE